jgi:hypothetical protein
MRELLLDVGRTDVANFLVAEDRDVEQSVNQICGPVGIQGACCYGVV